MFIDADKVNYSVYYEKALELLAPRGVIVIDNVLWGGSVLGPDNPDDEPEAGSTKAIKTLNELVQNDDRVVNVMLTVRDGMMLIPKTGRASGLTCCFRDAILVARHRASRFNDSASQRVEKGRHSITRGRPHDDVADG